jgi:hypothetical protein
VGIYDQPLRLLVDRAMQVASDVADGKGSGAMKARFIETQPNLFQHEFQ